MVIKSLKNIPVKEIVEAMVDAFKNYFFPMPDSVEFWEKRFQRAGVDYDSSYGVFDGDRLIAFIIHAVDQLDGVLTAYNTGTGVLEEYRGQRWVDQMYEFAIPLLKGKGIQEVTLEVIDINYPAMAVYERIGFKKEMLLFGYQGTITVEEGVEVEMEEGSLSLINERTSSLYSWDFRDEVVMKGADIYQLYRVIYNNKNCGYFVWSPSNGLIAQIEAEGNTYAPVLQAIGRLSRDVRINNVTEERKDLMKALESAGLVNHVIQYEMKMRI